MDLAAQEWRRLHDRILAVATREFIAKRLQEHPRDRHHAGTRRHRHPLLQSLPEQAPAAGRVRGGAGRAEHRLRGQQGKRDRQPGGAAAVGRLRELSGVRVGRFSPRGVARRGRGGRRGPGAALAARRWPRRSSRLRRILDAAAGGAPDALPVPRRTRRARPLRQPTNRWPSRPSTRPTAAEICSKRGSGCSWRPKRPATARWTSIPDSPGSRTCSTRWPRKHPRCRRVSRTRPSNEDRGPFGPRSRCSFCEPRPEADAGCRGAA